MDTQAPVPGFSGGALAPEEAHTLAMQHSSFLAVFLKLF